MKSIICLVAATLLTAGLAGCAYEDHQEYARSGYYTNDYGYSPDRQYQSRGDYYRHYNGIDG
jgi:hypothetical protein